MYLISALPRIKQQNIWKMVPDEYRMVSFDTASLFTNFLLEETFEIVSKRIYVNKEISTDIPTQELE